MTEGIFNFLNENKSISSSSAGINVAYNSVASKNTSAILKGKYGIDVSNKKAAQIENYMLKEADLIIAMTEFIRDYLKHRYEEDKEKMFTLKEYTGETVNLNILDPYGNDILIYQMCHDEIELYVKKLIEKLNKGT